jgi:hypothetical protein
MTGTYDTVRAPEVAVADLLDRLTVELRRYVVLSHEQAVVVALWVFHTHVLEAADATPYLHVTSATRESGKTRLLEVLELLVAHALSVVNISDAALFRAVDEYRPTLLFDEIDAVFGPQARDREDLRGMLNAGYTRAGAVLRMGGAKMSELQRFGVFCPKALAGIGALPDTIASRAVPIRLRRRTRDETVERFRRREAGPGLELLHIEMNAVGEPLLDRLAEARPALPDQLSDREQDVAEPLLAIADLAGSSWAASARHALIHLCTDRPADDATISVQLLADCRIVLDGNERMSTKDLLGALAAIEESPWATYDRGQPITPHGLGRLLQPFEVTSNTLRFSDGTRAKGYERPVSRTLSPVTSLPWAFHP